MCSFFIDHTLKCESYVSLQQKYFDSGDYNMAKAKIKNKQLPTAAPEKTEITGDHIPTPQDLPQRKPSLVASKLAGWCTHSLDSPCSTSPLWPLHSRLRAVTLPLPPLTVPVPCLCTLPTSLDSTQQEPTPSELASWYLQILFNFVFTPCGPLYCLLSLFPPLLLQTDCPSVIVFLLFHVPFYFLFTSM